MQRVGSRVNMLHLTMFKFLKVDLCYSKSVNPNRNLLIQMKRCCSLCHGRKSQGVSLFSLRKKKVTQYFTSWKELDNLENAPSLQSKQHF